MIDISVNCKFDHVFVSSKKIREYCLSHRISDKMCDEIEICIVEALNNIIEHSYKSISSNCINIEANFQKPILEIKIFDAGMPRKNFSKPELNIDPSDIDSLPERGMGLFIISQLTDELIYESNHGINILTMIKSCKK